MQQLVWCGFQQELNSNYIYSQEQIGNYKFVWEPSRDLVTCNTTALFSYFFTVYTPTRGTQDQKCVCWTQEREGLEYHIKLAINTGHNGAATYHGWVSPGVIHLSLPPSQSRLHLSIEWLVIANSTPHHSDNICIYVLVQSRHGNPSNQLPNIPS
jgi:hypothetical protein